VNAPVLTLGKRKEGCLRGGDWWKDAQGTVSKGVPKKGHEFLGIIGKSQGLARPGGG